MNILKTLVNLPNEDPDSKLAQCWNKKLIVNEKD